jgi:hypothetical protein
LAHAAFTTDLGLCVRLLQPSICASRATIVAIVLVAVLVNKWLWKWLWKHRAVGLVGATGFCGCAA